MSDEALIRITKEPREIFQDIFLSLESSRPSKSEKDILDEVASHFDLPVQKDQWADTLVSKGTSIEDLLDVVFRELRPFVLMVFEIYRFLSKVVSTTGGRTTHFEISADGKKYKLDFPDVDFPKKVRWIQSWGKFEIRLVKVDWDRVADLLVIDSGIFYGRVRDKKLIQSLIIARREGTLSPTAADTAKQIYQSLRRTLQAWWRSYLNDSRLENEAIESKWIATAFVPALRTELVRTGVIRPDGDRSSDVGINIEVVLGIGRDQYTLEEAFTDPVNANVDARGQNENHHNVAAALFFVAMWGLDDHSFGRVARLLTAHEDGTDLLRDAELDGNVKKLGEEFINEVGSLIVDTGLAKEAEGEIHRKVEILLLPYWKDRWFLYEVWTLTIPLLEAIAAGVHVELLGVKPISNEGIVGTNWNLPTQKAREPVAKLTEQQSHRELLVWFQRETTTPTGHMEPDIRITNNVDQYDDLLILECKDRVKFGRTSAERVAQNYLEGSAAKTVWIIDYEDVAAKSQKESELTEVNGRHFGLVYNFKPESGNTMVRTSIRELFETALPPPRPSLYLLIDVSGSMSEKRLPNLDEFRLGGNRFTTEVYEWGSAVDQIGWERIAHAFSIKDLGAGGFEDAAALENFAATLPPEARLVIVTDASGRDTLARDLPGFSQNYAPQVSGHAVELIII